MLSPVPAVVRAEYTAEPNNTLLLNPAWRIEQHDDSVVFRGSRYTYTILKEGEEWRVRQENNSRRLDRSVRDPYVYHGPEGTWCFDGMLAGDNGVLRGWCGADTLSAPVFRRTLWDRQKLLDVWLGGSGYLEVDEPIVEGVASLEGLLWIAIGFYAGEGFRGLGTLVCVDPTRRTPARSVQRPELVLSSLSGIAAADGALWIGTCFPGEFQLYRDKGLARFDPSDSSVTFFPPAADPLGGEVCTALSGSSDALWFATDAGMGRLRLADRAWRRWKIVPYVTLDDEAPVHSHPKLAPRGRLPAGDYEVRWVDTWVFPGWAELVTPGLIRGWIEQERFLELAKNEFEVAPVILTAFVNPAPERFTLYDQSGREEVGHLTRVRQHASGRETEREGEVSWIEVYAHAGWIRFADRAVRMRIVRDPAEADLPDGGMPSERPN